MYQQNTKCNLAHLCRYPANAAIYNLMSVRAKMPFAMAIQKHLKQMTDRKCCLHDAMHCLYFLYSAERHTVRVSASVATPGYICVNLNAKNRRRKCNPQMDREKKGNFVILLLLLLLLLCFIEVDVISA